MNRTAEDGSPNWFAGLPELRKAPDLSRAIASRDTTRVANDLTSVRIQSLAGRGLIDPKSLKLREIQELSASIISYIRQQHTPSSRFPAAVDEKAGPLVPTGPDRSIGTRL